ncbi:MAG: ATP-binding protein [Gemmatimonadota bacterium]
MREGEVSNLRVVVSWSTGKDSAWCLHELRISDEVEVVGLLATVTPAFGRVSVHGTRLSLLRAQAEGLGFDVWEVELPYPCANEDYERVMGGVVRSLVDERGATHLAFGDLFLEDIREYREGLLEGTGVEPLFPLWGRDTRELAGEMEAGGIDAVIVAAPESSSVAGLVGTRWSREALKSFPDVDPCGERGEFHTCVIGAPGLPPIDVEVGEKVQRDGSVYVDLELANG